MFRLVGVVALGLLLPASVAVAVEPVVMPSEVVARDDDGVEIGRIGVVQAPLVAPVGSPWRVFPSLVSDRRSRVGFQFADDSSGGRQSALVLRFGVGGKVVSRRVQNLDVPWVNTPPQAWQKEGAFWQDAPWSPSDLFSQLPGVVRWSPFRLVGLIGGSVVGTRPEPTESGSSEQVSFQTKGPDSYTKYFWVPTYRGAVAVVGKTGLKVPFPVVDAGGTKLSYPCNISNSEGGALVVRSYCPSSAYLSGVASRSPWQASGWLLTVGRGLYVARHRDYVDPNRDENGLSWQGLSVDAGSLNDTTPTYDLANSGDVPFGLSSGFVGGVAPVPVDVDRDYENVALDEYSGSRRRGLWFSGGFRMGWAAGRSGVVVRGRSGRGLASVPFVLRDPCRGRRGVGGCERGFPDGVRSRSSPSALGYGLNGVFVAGNRRVTVWDRRSGRVFSRVLPWERLGQRTVFVTPPVATRTKLAFVSVSRLRPSGDPVLRLLDWPTARDHRGWKQVR